MNSTAGTLTPKVRTYARHLVGMARVALAGQVLAAPANYAYCILDKAPTAQNDVAAGAVQEVCIADHPGGLEAVKQGSGRDMVFGYKSGPACVAAKGQDTRSIRAAQLVSAACRKLYEFPFDPSTARRTD